MLQINMYRNKTKDSLQWETTKPQSIDPRCKLLADVKEGTEQKCYMWHIITILW